MRPFPVRAARAFKSALHELKGKRSAFDGADLGRLFSDWMASLRGPDEELRGDVRMLRARARDLSRNNAYIKHYLRLLKINVIGPMGIRLQAQVWAGKNLDAKTNAAIEAAWNDWASHPVTVDGRLTLRQFEKLLRVTQTIDGEAFVRLWRSFDGNRYGLGLQAIDADLIDIQYNRQATPGKNEIRMGVEVDKLSRPVGYWVWDKTMYSGIELVRERYFVPASEMIHLYDPNRMNQTRGVTEIHAAMVPSRRLDGYEDTEAIAARAASAKMGFFVRTGDSATVSTGDAKKPLTMNAEPATFEAIDEGWGLADWNPQHPTSQFGSFVKQMLRKISSALGVFYNVLANDAEQVTYSTMRSFSLVERDLWRSLQQDFIEMWRRPLTEAWLGMALLRGALVLPSRNPERYLSGIRHRPRGWQWIDPEKETKAGVLGIENGLATRTSILAERGEDIEDVFAELAREQELAEEYGISIEGQVPGEKKLTQAEWEAQAEEAGGENTGAS